MSYTAQIRIKRDGVQVYQESQTFARKQAAQAWTRKRESELDEPGAIERASRKGVTVKDMIDQYLVEVEKARPLGKTKKATLEAIGKMEIGILRYVDKLRLGWKQARGVRQGNERGRGLLIRHFNHWLDSVRIRHINRWLDSIRINNLNSFRLRLRL